MVGDSDDDYVAAIKGVLDQLRRHRRRIAAGLNPINVETTAEALARVQLQMEAIQRALADEEGHAKSEAYRKGMLGIG